jgi:hypothetical protein
LQRLAKHHSRIHVVGESWLSRNETQLFKQRKAVVDHPGKHPDTIRSRRSNPARLVARGNVRPAFQQRAIECANASQPRGT